MNTQIQGKNFSINGKRITIFGLNGLPKGENWIMGGQFSEDGSYVDMETVPTPALAKVLKIIGQDIIDGNYEQIHMVVMSNRVAVRLFLEGALEDVHFINAKEGELNGVPFMLLIGCNFGEHFFPIGILPESLIGATTMATLDSNYRIVGDATGKTFALPTMESLKEIEAIEPQ